MFVALLDTETTGLLVNEDKVIEIGCVLYDTDARQPVRMYDSLIRPRDPLPEGYVSPTGIKGEWLTLHGVSFPEAMGEVQRILATMPEPILVGHNIINFDKPILQAELARDNIVDHGLNTAHIIDTRQDIPFQQEPSSRRLVHMLAEFAKTINPFEHRALFDAVGCAKLLDLFPFEKILENSRQPLITLRALVTYEMEKERQGAKEMRFSFDGKKKLWTKQIRANALDRETAAAALRGFSVVTI